MNEATKAKYKFGQKVFTIKNGFLESFTIKGIFLDRWGESVKYTDSKLSDSGTLGDTYFEYELFPTKKALLKDLESEETD